MTLSLNDIHQTIRSIQIEGHKVEELEALVVHNNDLVSLLKAINANGNNMSPVYSNALHDPGEIKILGIKIIESPYIQQGSIFKIFKNDKPYVYPSKNGVTPNWSQHTTTIAESGQSDFEAFKHKPGFTPLVQKPNNLQLPMITDEKKKEQIPKKKKKHSKTRKIELD